MMNTGIRWTTLLPIVMGRGQESQKASRDMYAEVMVRVLLAMMGGWSIDINERTSKRTIHEMLRDNEEA